MGPIDEKIMNLLRNGEPREFEQLLREAGFSHNTLRLHIDSLVEGGIIMKDKLPAKGRGRPKFTYSMLPRSSKVSIICLNESTGVVSLSFNKLSQICRFEKSGFCEKAGSSCNAQNSP